MEAHAAGNFHDWEVLPPTSDFRQENTPDSDEQLKAFDALEGDSEGMIRPDYFSLDSHPGYKMSHSMHVSEEGSVQSDNPSWIDPALDDSPFHRTISGEFWSDSSSDHSVDHKFSSSEVQSELGFLENVSCQVGFERTSEIQTEDGDDGSKSWADSGGSFHGERHQAPMVNADAEDVEAQKVKLSSERANSMMVWWKLPVELLKYCVLKAGPLWSVSLAAAVMGFVILGRRLYKMKRKSPSLKLKVSMDEKKVSQFMTRAARLNEAFSVARRVPMIRPSLPATGMTPSWSMMILR